MDIEGEIWKDIETIPYHQAAWPFHQVSNKGRIRVLPGGMIQKRVITKTELRVLTRRENGENSYIIIHHGKRKLYIHVLVLNAFVGPCPPEQECRHLNGNPSDNRLENLEWGTRKKNQEDRVRHETSNRGERCGSSKLTKTDVIDIRSRLESFGIGRKLARDYGVSPATISMIRNNKRWEYI